MTLEELKAMRGGDILASVRDALLERASVFRSFVEHSNDSIKFDWSAHDAQCAAAALIERIRATGKDQAERKVKIDRLVELSVDEARSALILEMTKREPAASSSPPQESCDVRR